MLKFVGLSEYLCSIQYVPVSRSVVLNLMQSALKLSTLDKIFSRRQIDNIFRMGFLKNLYLKIKMFGRAGGQMSSIGRRLEIYLLVNLFEKVVHNASKCFSCSYFSQKIGIDISCTLFPMETICIKCQCLLSGKNKKNKRRQFV